MSSKLTCLQLTYNWFHLKAFFQANDLTIITNHITQHACHITFVHIHTYQRTPSSTKQIC